MPGAHDEGGREVLTVMRDTAGCHVNVWTPETRRSVRRHPPARLKVYSAAVDVSELAQWKAARPNGRLLYSHYLPDEGRHVRRPVSQRGSGLQELRVGQSHWP